METEMYSRLAFFSPINKKSLHSSSIKTELEDDEWKNMIKVCGCIVWCLSYLSMAFHAFASQRSTAWPVETSAIAISWEFVHGFLPFMVYHFGRNYDKKRDEPALSVYLNAIWFLCHVPLAISICLYGNVGSVSILKHILRYAELIFTWGMIQYCLSGRNWKYLFGWFIVIYYPLNSLQYANALPMAMERSLMWIGNFCYVSNYWGSSTVSIVVEYGKKSDHKKEILMKSMMVFTMLFTTFHLLR